MRSRSGSTSTEIRDDARSRSVSGLSSARITCVRRRPRAPRSDARQRGSPRPRASRDVPKVDDPHPAGWDYPVGPLVPPPSPRVPGAGRRPCESMSATRRPGCLDQPADDSLVHARCSLLGAVGLAVYGSLSASSSARRGAPGGDPAVFAPALAAWARATGADIRAVLGATATAGLVAVPAIADRVLQLQLGRLLPGLRGARRARASGSLLVVRRGARRAGRSRRPGRWRSCRSSG